MTQPPTESTRTLLEKYKETGEEQYLEALIEKNNPKLTRWLIVLTGEGLHIEDLLQEVWVQVVQRISIYDPLAGGYAWINKIAKHTAHNAIREGKALKRGGQETIISMDERTETWAGGCDKRRSFRADDDVLAVEEKIDQLNDVFGQLSPRNRDFLTCIYYEQMPYEQVAKRFGIKPSGVASKKRKLVQRLRKFMKKRAVA